MSLQAGTHHIGPENGSLRIRTGRAGAAAKAGHDLLLEATSWSGTVEIGDDPSVRLTVEPGSLDVLEGTGGVKALTDKDKASIKEDITSKVLGSSQISFESTRVQVGDGALSITGDLSIAGRSGSISAPLGVDADGAVSGSITVSQSDFGIKQYKALMGALKVADDVQVDVKAKLPTG